MFSTFIVPTPYTLSFSFFVFFSLARHLVTGLYSTLRSYHPFAFRIVLGDAFTFRLCIDMGCTFVVHLAYFSGHALDINELVLSYHCKVPCVEPITSWICRPS